jgi:hypothetical protein
MIKKRIDYPAANEQIKEIEGLASQYNARFSPFFIIGYKLEQEDKSGKLS